MKNESAHEGAPEVIAATASILTQSVESNQQVPLRFRWERTVRSIQMDPSTKLVALLLATYADKDGTKVRPGLKRLAEDAGLSRRTMMRATSALREMGLLDRINRGSNLGKRDLVDVYRLVIPTNNQVTHTSPSDTSGSNDVTPMTHPDDARVHLPNQYQVNNHLSPEERAVAKALHLQDDDERLKSVDQMIKDNHAKNPLAWIFTCAKNGSLAGLLDEARKNGRIRAHLYRGTYDPDEAAKAKREAVPPPANFREIYQRAAQESAKKTRESEDLTQ